MSDPLLLLAHQFAVLTRDGGILPNLDKQFGTGLALLSEHNRLPAYALLQTAQLLHSMGVATEGKGQLRASCFTVLLHLVQIMYKPGEISMQIYTFRRAMHRLWESNCHPCIGMGIR